MNQFINKVNMQGYKPEFLDVPTAQYLVQFETITNKKQGEHEFYELKHTILNGVDAKNQPKKVELTDSIYLNSDFAKNAIYKAFNALGLSLPQIEAGLLEHAKGFRCLIDYTSAEDATPSKNGKQYARCKYSKFKNTPVALVTIVGNIAPTQPQQFVAPVAPQQPQYTPQTQPQAPVGGMAAQYSQPVASQAQVPVQQAQQPVAPSTPVAVAPVTVTPQSQAPQAPQYPQYPQQPVAVAPVAPQYPQGQKPFGQ